MKILILTRGERPALDIFVRWKFGFFISALNSFSKNLISKRRLIFFIFLIFASSAVCVSQNRFLSSLRTTNQPVNTFPTDSWRIPSIWDSLIDHFSLATRCYWGHLVEVNPWWKSDVARSFLMRNIITNTPNRPEHPRVARSLPFFKVPLWFWALLLFFFSGGNFFLRPGISENRPRPGKRQVGWISRWLSWGSRSENCQGLEESLRKMSYNPTRVRSSCASGFFEPRCY